MLLLELIHEILKLMESADDKQVNHSQQENAEALADPQIKSDEKEVESGENNINENAEKEDGALPNEDKQLDQAPVQDGNPEQQGEDDAEKLKTSAFQGTKSQFHKPTETNEETETNQEQPVQYQRPIETLTYSGLFENKNEDAKKVSQRYEPEPLSGKTMLTPQKPKTQAYEPETADSPNQDMMRSSGRKKMAASYYSSWQDDAPLRRSALFSSNGFGMMSDYHSAATLQQSVMSFVFPKAERFHSTPQHPHLGSIELPSCRSARTTTLGFGRKVQMADLKLNSVRDFPSPGKYSLKSSVDMLKDKKFTFRASYKAYEKVHLPGYTQLLPAVAAELPGPGQYEINRDPSGKTKVGFRLKGKMFSEMVNMDTPACNKYNIDSPATKNERFKGIGFGFGRRSDFTNTKIVSPGPGTYRLGSAFDKFAGKPWDRKVKKGLSQSKEFVIRKF